MLAELVTAPPAQEQCANRIQLLIRDGLHQSAHDAKVVGVARQVGASDQHLGSGPHGVQPPHRAP